MTLFSEWKFFLTLLVTLVGVAIPVWVWQADLSSKTLSMKLNTRVLLQPKEQDPLPGLEISVDGARLLNPHLVVFEIRNDGSKPISASDFESSLDILMESKTSFVRSEVTSKSPKDIEATITSEPQRISLKPTLLNPKDSIEITAITSGSPPVFGSKARIVGISDLSLEDGTKEKTSKTTLVLLLFGSMLFLVSFNLTFNVINNPNGVFLRRRAAMFVALVSVFPGAIALNTFLEKIEIQGFWHYMLYYFILIILASFIADALNRKNETTSE
jgi:hypothetical protein